MARKKTPTLTEAELRIMTVVWETNGATVNDVLSALPAGTNLAYNTVLTTMRILEQKRYLRHDKEGRAHIYRPCITRAQARRKAVQHIVKSFFDNSPELLLLNILDNEKISDDELERLKKMTDETDKES